MAEYCSSTDVQNRLTEAGVKYGADRNASGGVSAAETAAYMTTAIQYAGGLIDAAIYEQCDPANARAQATAGTCPWLRDRAVDLAAYRFATHGGREAPAVLLEAARSAQALLDNVQANRRPIPGLTYSYPTNGQSTVGARVVNVS